MASLDWLVLIGTLSFIVLYGALKTRKSRNIEDYLLGDKKMKWWTIGLSVMATQASAITFLSTPGQGFESGLSFVQFYFGLPLAIIILCIFVVPIYYRLKVFTAYEYLESRFDLKTRLLAAFLFLIQRGLAAGITIFAPSIILTTILGWDLAVTNIMVGLLVIVYTVSGGSKAVSLTQKWQMGIILVGMLIAFFFVLYALPKEVTFFKALNIAGLFEKMNAIDLSVDLNNRYTLWSGLTGGLFLAMSYFGTDQSQVQRYLSGRSIRESQLGLTFNAILKIPMQFFILLTGVLVFVFYQFEPAPLFFNPNAVQEFQANANTDAFRAVEDRYAHLAKEKQTAMSEYMNSAETADYTAMREKSTTLRALHAKQEDVRSQAKALLKEANPNFDAKDEDYVFITFVLRYLPAGVVGLLLATILSAAMSSTAGEINALASTTTVDIYKRLLKPDANEKHYVNVSRWLTVFWGVIAILFALFAHMVENLIEAVNILGSIFYGTILGIFLAAFFLKSIRGSTVFIAAIPTQLGVIALFFFSDIGFLWYNVIGCASVICLSLLINKWANKKPGKLSPSGF